MEIHRKSVEPWRVTLVDTGENSMTGGRLRRVSEYLGKEDFVLLTAMVLATLISVKSFNSIKNPAD